MSESGSRRESEEESWQETKSQMQKLAVETTQEQEPEEP